MSRVKYPSINGLRAISILIMVFYHLVGMKYLSAETIIPWLQPFTRIWSDGFMAVNVFFVISGYLITALLLNEEFQNKTISLRDFFIRRTLRIFPAYYFLLLVYAIFQFYQIIHINWGSWATAITYTKYFNWKKDWFTSHAWTLGIEEHFYLLWPLIFMRGNHFRKYATIVMIASVPAVRILMAIFEIRWLNDQMIFTRIDAIAIGCFFALYQGVILQTLSRHWTRHFYLSVGLLLALPYLPELFGKINLAFLFIPFGSTYGTIANFAIATIMMYSVFGPQRIWFWFLNLRFMNYIGLLSYSIYLWQQFFIYKSDQWWNQFPLNLLLILGCALFSYYAVEKPFLKLKSKFSRT
jgi:peptidoglycan/LPS O-acetylase OafA/YrhL